MLPNLNSLPKRQRLLILIAGAGVVLLILNSVVFSPLGDLWSSHAAEIQKLQTSIANGRSAIARGPQTRRIWAEIKSGSLPLDEAQSQNNVLTALASWGRASGIELGSIRPLWKQGTANAYSLLECRLDATGTLGGLGRFLYEMEKSPLALRVDSVEFSSRDDSGQRLTLSLVVTGLRLAPYKGKQ